MAFPFDWTRPQILHLSEAVGGNIESGRKVIERRDWGLIKPHAWHNAPVGEVGGG